MTVENKAEESRQADLSAPPIEGLLLLFALGIILNPMLNSLNAKQFFQMAAAADWSSLHQATSTFLLFEGALHALLCVTSLLIIYPFFARWRIVPRLIIGLYALYFVAGIVSVVLASRIPGDSQAIDSEAIRFLIQMVFLGLVWGSYFLFSKRVEKTFIADIPSWIEGPFVSLKARIGMTVGTERVEPAAKTDPDASTTEPSPSSTHEMNSLWTVALFRRRSLLIAMIGLLMAAVMVYMNAYPWTYSQCLEWASSRPTDQGVGIAMIRCRELREEEESRCAEAKPWQNY